jgi:hypothetical protein
MQTPPDFYLICIRILQHVCLAEFSSHPHIEQGGNSSVIPFHEFHYRTIKLDGFSVGISSLSTLAATFASSPSIAADELPAASLEASTNTAIDPPHEIVPVFTSHPKQRPHVFPKSDVFSPVILIRSLSIESEIFVGNRENGLETLKPKLSIKIDLQEINISLSEVLLKISVVIVIMSLACVFFHLHVEIVRL